VSAEPCGRAQVFKDPKAIEAGEATPTQALTHI
jgi:hypothetical protein